MTGFKKNTKGAGQIFALILMVGLMAIIGIAGFYVGNKVAFGYPSNEHKTIVENIHVVDLDANIQLSLEFIQSTNSKMLYIFGQGQAGQFNINADKYQLSEWRWKIGGDPDAYMNVWGAGEDGRTYYIEIGSFSGHRLQIDTPTGQKTLTPTDARYEFLVALD